MAVVVVGGCAGPRPAPELPARPAPAGGVLDEGDLIDLPVTAAEAYDTDSDPLYRLLVAEFAGQRGRLDLAVDQYVETAKQLRDLAIAKRATRIAIFAHDDAAALQAAQIWVDQAPGDPEAR